MTDDNSTIAWRLAQLENAVRDLSQRVVGADLYARDRAELERDIADIRRELAEEKLARKEGDRDLKSEITGQGSNWRQAIYAGVIPSVLFLLTLLWQIKGGK